LEANKEEERKIEKVTLEFLTPVNFRKDGKAVNRLDFGLLISALLRRYNQLEQFYGNSTKTASKEFCLMLKKAAQEAETLESLVSYEGRSRYTYRDRFEKNENHDLIGIRGVFQFAHSEMEIFLSLLRFGEYSNVGRNTTFGMGRYLIREF
jgi:CRISPR/Cas system endoribonuclease Cas6 (RAMP superfamily)